MTQPSHIFIVGSYRSGTTLLRYVLNSSRDVAICGETHFLKYKHLTRKGFREEFAAVGDMSTDIGVNKIVNHIYSMPARVFWRWVQQHVDREEFQSRLLQTSDRTARTLFDLVMDFYARGKPIRGEKTPAHIYDVPTLLAWFPEAKVVHMLRDPRAVYVSIKKFRSEREAEPLPFRLLRRGRLALEAYMMLNVLVTWLRVVRLHYKYQQLYGDRYYLCKFEDLIRDPRAQLEELCKFLEIEFGEAMLQQAVINSSFVPRNGQTLGFDTSTLDRWQRHIHPVVNNWFRFFCRKHLVALGYQR